MKRNVFYLMTTIVTSVLLISCTDLSDINNRLDEHEKRLKNLEELTIEANNSLSTLQQLVNAQSQKITIVSYSPLENGLGYKLVMSDGSEITLKNGPDGTSPNVAVTMNDGVLYWTINGELLLDANGNPISAEGKDGDPGISPKLRVNINGQWEVSQDGGSTWQLVTDSDGNPVKAIGEDAEVDLSISEDSDGNIVIVFNGQTFVIPTKKMNDLTSKDKFANCFMISESGLYKFETKQINGNSLEGIVSANWLWSTKTGEQGLLKNVKYQDGYISFEVTQGRGNGLIAAFDENNKVVWSWHIWVTDPVKLQEYESGFKLMDRNLGATSNKYEDGYKFYGLYYQWGRKDPFYGGEKNEDKSEPAFVEAEKHVLYNPDIEDCKWTAVQGDSHTGTVAYAVENPMVLIYETTEQKDWLAVIDNTLWGNEKTNYDPCPYGYKVPNNEVWKGFSSYTGFDNKEHSAKLFKIKNGETAAYGFSGARWGDKKDPGILGYTGVYGSATVWSCTNNNTTGGCLYMMGGSYVSSNYGMDKAHAVSVRCVKM